MLIKLYWFAALATAVIWTLVGWKLGLPALMTVIVLTLLEITFSADNAVVNSKVLVGMSPFWQKLFMTVGIVFAVFIVRFILPIFIVMLTASLGFGQVLDLALHHPHQYADALHHAAPFINAFGGTFLLMIALSFFIDYEKETHWIGWLERRLGKLGQFENITTFITLLVSLALYLTVGDAYRGTVFVASIIAMALHIGLDLLDALMSRAPASQGLGSKPAATGQRAVVHKTGLAAFGAFMYLQVLDASFSLDGVIGAFAITGSVILIMAGLGAGAVWVRSMTLHLVKARTLSKYLFLEHGAHWAIGFLGSIMLLHLYHVELPEWFVGGLGLVFITAAILWSKRYTRKQAEAPTPQT